MQIARFRQLALQLHPDKHEGADESEKERIAKEFRRVRIAHAVLSTPTSAADSTKRATLRRARAASPIKPFHEYYSINTPVGTRAAATGLDTPHGPRRPALNRSRTVSSNDCPRHVAALARPPAASTRVRCRSGSVLTLPLPPPLPDTTRWSVRSTARATRRAAKSQMGALQHEEVIRLGPRGEQAPRLPRPANAPDQYHQYWDRMKERIPASKEESAPSWKKGAQLKLIAQTRYMPLEEEDRDHVQRAQLQQSGIKGPHTET